MQMLLLFSGPTAVGKSEVAKVLIGKHQFKSLGSGSYLKGRAHAKGLDASRTGLQHLGDSFDVDTDYRWIVDDVAVPGIKANPAQAFWLLDSVRKKRQVEHFRNAFGDAALHVHFVAPEEVLQKRYDERIAAGGEYDGNTPYAVAKNNPNEVSSRSLEEIAEVVLDLTKSSPEEAAAEILKRVATRRKHASGGTD